MTTRGYNKRVRARGSINQSQNFKQVQVNNFTSQLGVLSFSLQDIMGQFARIGDPALKRMAEEFTVSLEFAQNNRYRINSSLERAAAFAQTVTIENYDRVRGASPVRSYKSDTRLSGRLRPALASGSFWATSAEGVSFGNVDMLNATAPHWARLNFGAGIKGEGGEVRKGSESINYPHPRGRANQANFENFGTFYHSRAPRPGFEVPPGFWFNETGTQPLRPRFNRKGSTGRFYVYRLPLKEEVKKRLESSGDIEAGPSDGASGLSGYVQKRRKTAGIAPWRFLDYGIQALYQGIAYECEGLLEQWIEDAANDKVSSPVYKAEMVLGKGVRGYETGNFGAIPTGPTGGFSNY